MASTSNVEEAISGIILRTSAAPSGRHAYFSIPTTASGDHPLTAAPHFPDITILDAIPCNILYQTHNSFHVHNFSSRSHFHLPFPHPLDFVNAAIVTHKCNNFKVLVACVKDKRLVFFVYSSERRSWSQVRTPSFLITSDELLSNRRKPVHVEEDVAFLDLIDDFLIRFDSWKEQVELIPKLVCSWEDAYMADAGDRCTA